MGSNMASEGVRAARINRTKKIVPIARPPGMTANTAGNTSNTSVGPAAGSMWKRKTRGNTNIVASSETSRIEPVTTNAGRTNGELRGMYAPYASMTAAPTPVA